MFSPFVTVAEDNNQILVAKGSKVDYHLHYDVLISPSYEVLSLDITSLTWSRLPNFPERVATSNTRTGTLIKNKNKDSVQCIYVAINSNC